MQVCDYSRRQSIIIMNMHPRNWGDLRWQYTVTYYEYASMISHLTSVPVDDDALESGE